MAGQERYEALGNLASGVAAAIQKKNDQKYEKEKSDHEMLTRMVSAGIESGTIENPNDAFQFLVNGGKSGKKPKDLPPMLKTLIGSTKHLFGGGGATQQQPTGAPAGGPQNTQPQPTGAPAPTAEQAQTEQDSSMSPGTPVAPKPAAATPGQPGPAAAKPGGNTPRFLSQSQRDDQNIAFQKRQQSEITEPQAAANHRRRMEELALQQTGKKGTADKEPTQNADGKWTIKVRDPEGNVIYEQPSNGPKQTGALAERVKQLVAQGIPPDRAPAVAAKQMETERGQLQRDRATRLDAYLQSSRAALLTSKERLAEMQESFPYLLATRMSGSDTANYRAAITEYKAATLGPGANAAKASAAASKIVQAATKQAAALAGKESTILKALGLEDDEKAIRRNLIQEMSGGEDPDVVEMQARLAVSPADDKGGSSDNKGGPKAGGGGGQSDTPTKTQDTPRRRIAARQYLQQNRLPVNEANIKHYLVTAPVEAAPAAAEAP
jgi:hypothetical protein